MSHKANKVFVLMHRDYMTVITRANPYGREVVRWERIMKARVTKILEELKEATARDDLAAKIKSNLEEEQAVEHNNEVRKDETAKKASLEESVPFESLPNTRKMI